MEVSGQHGRYAMEKCNHTLPPRATHVDPKSVTHYAARHMKTETAIKFYKSARKLAKAAEVSRQAVTRWKKTGLVPEDAAYRLHVTSGYKLKVHPEHYA